MDSNWLKNSQKGMKLPLDVATSPVTIAATTRVVGGVKICVSTRGINLGGRPHWSRKMFQKTAEAVENDDKNVVANDDCGGAGASDGYRSIAGREAITIVPV